MTAADLLSAITARIQEKSGTRRTLPVRMVGGPRCLPRAGNQNSGHSGPGSDRTSSLYADRQPSAAQVRRLTH